MTSPPATGPGLMSTVLLPSWRSVLAVVAHPDDESFGLGAILDGFVRADATVSVLCLTQGEASRLSAPGGDLTRMRAMELENAARELAVSSAVLCRFPDSGLASVERAALATEVLREMDQRAVDGMVVFDPSGVTGHQDHAAATAAALDAAAHRDVPVLGWTVSQVIAEQLNDEFGTAFIGHRSNDVDLAVKVDRDRQRMASLAHASQATPTSVMWRRLELSGGVECLRWLRRADAPSDVAAATHAAVAPTTTPAAGEVQSMRVQWKAGDRFDIDVRAHTITVDQPSGVGGDDLGPTPTELFVAGLASCVAFYARRYLRRHHIDPSGLEVTTQFTMGAKPARVAAVDMQIHLSAELPPNRRDGLLAQAAHCTVHNSITHAPDITITLAATS